MADVRRIVVVTAREDLRAAVLRLGALSGAAVEVLAGSGGVRAVWRTAQIVVVGSDLAGAVASAGLPRRPDVVVIATEEPDVALWQSAVELGARQVLTLPADEQSLVELMSDAVEPRTAAGSTIAVIGGCGGAGASTFAAGLALAGVRTGQAVLVDGDQFGGGLDVLLGAERSPGARWPELAGTRGRLSAAALREALVQVEGVAVLSWDRAGSRDLQPDAAAAVMDAATRGFRWVIIDLPRHLDPASVVLTAAADLVVMVVPATVRAVAAAATVAPAVLSQTGQLRLVVRDARAGHLAAREIAGALGLPVLATVHSEPGVADAAERGEPPLRRLRGSLHDACLLVLEATTVVAAAA
jgi:secretion/DNA translocation related CpaE-like protein